MSSTVISVNNISKRYRIGLSDKQRDTFAGQIMDVVRSPFRNFRRLRNLTNFKNEEGVFWALRDISFEVKQGEVLGIIGHNGAGKSTLLKILSRITEPTTGEIEIRGRVSSLLEVGTGFHPDLTGRENIYMNGTILGMKKKEIDVKFDEIVAFSGVEKHIDTAVKFYSSGMKVRLAFSVAAYLEPEILIIDEVLAVGDADFQRKCLGKMEDVANRGRTVLFVSHNMLAVKSLCKTGILLNHGCIVKQGLAEEVVNQYLQAYAPKSKVIFLPDNALANNDRIELKKILIKTKSEDGTFLITENFAIEIEFNNKASDGNYNINLFFNAPDGTNIFVSVSEIVSIKHGPFVACCHIPQNVLNDEFYNLDLMVVESGIKPVFHFKNIITIQGVEPPRRTAWMGKFPGMIRPKFEWKVSN